MSGTSIPQKMEEVPKEVLLAILGGGETLGQVMETGIRGPPAHFNPDPRSFISASCRGGEGNLQCSVMEERRW